MKKVGQLNMPGWEEEKMDTSPLCTALEQGAGNLFSGGAHSVIERALRSLRHHLKMDLAFISEFSEETRLFRSVDTALDPPPLKAGDVLSLSEGYCLKVVQGQLPQLIPDTSTCPAAMAIPATTGMPIGSHLSVPLKLTNGDTYGTLCCFSLKADPTLNQRDLDVMYAFADLIGQQIEKEAYEALEQSEKLKRISGALQNNEPLIVYQPIFRLSDGAITGAEALSRFTEVPSRSPEKWYSEARDIGLRTSLEQQAIANSLRGYAAIWRDSALDLNVNASPQTIIDGGLHGIFSRYPMERIIIEVTEHDEVDDYDALAQALVPLRSRGVRLAIDDAGSGYASMRHILNLNPDIIKLDVTLTRDIDTDPMKRALAKALVSFGRQIKSKIVGEGVETERELAALKSIGVEKGQGYFLARPGDVRSLTNRLSHAASGRVTSQQI